MARLRRLLKVDTPPKPVGFVLPTVTDPEEKQRALQLLAEHTVQLSRIDAEVDAYRAALRANRLRRRAGDRK